MPVYLLGGYITTPRLTLAKTLIGTEGWALSRPIKLIENGGTGSAFRWCDEWTGRSRSLGSEHMAIGTIAATAPR